MEDDGIMWRQITAGSVVLCGSTALHVLLLAATIGVLEDLSPATLVEEATALFGAFLAILAGHTAQVWMWALATRACGALEDLEDAVYFALVTTTTLGYGDITLRRRWRLFGAMAAVSGLLTFGLSTAFFIGAFTRVFLD